MIFPDLMPDSGEGAITIRKARVQSALDRIVDIVAEEYGIPSRHILSPSRGGADAAQARQVVYWTLYSISDAPSYKTVSRAIGRDHSTVMHGIKKIKRLCEGDSLFREFCENILVRALGR